MAKTLRVTFSEVIRKSYICEIEVNDNFTEDVDCITQAEYEMLHAKAKKASIVDQDPDESDTEIIDIELA